MPYSFRSRSPYCLVVLIIVLISSHSSQTVLSKINRMTQSVCTLAYLTNCVILLKKTIWLHFFFFFFFFCKIDCQYQKFVFASNDFALHCVIILTNKYFDFFRIPWTSKLRTNLLRFLLPRVRKWSLLDNNIKFQHRRLYHIAQAP